MPRPLGAISGEEHLRDRGIRLGMKGRNQYESGRMALRITHGMCFEMRGGEGRGMGERCG